MDNQITVTTQNLPTNIEDLSRFVLIGTEKLVAVRAEIRAIEKVGLAREVYEQKKREAQELGEAVLDAETKVGELMARVPKAKNQYDNAVVSGVHSTKADVIEQAGFTVKQVQRFETMAAHPKAVAQAKAEAREKGEIVTRQSVLDKIREEKEDSKKQKNLAGDKETREIYKTVYAAMDNDGKSEFDINDLVEEIKINGENYIRILRNTVSIRTNILNNEEAKHRVFTAIEDVIHDIVKVRGEFAS